MDRWWEPPPETLNASNDAHLFVCQHGLWGSPEDVSFLEQYLQHNGWLTLNARSNSARCTFDGADVCGDRLAAEVVSHVQRQAAGGVRVTQISFAAYSFGGLIARYAVGKLLSSGFFSQVTPVNFLTIATPHLGCWEHPSSMSQLAYNSILPWTLSRTGRQLLLVDRWLEPEGLPLLAAMARPDCAFHAALAAFRKRVLLADIRSDRTVPYKTAAICNVNPYLPSDGRAVSATPYVLSPWQRPQPSCLCCYRRGDEGELRVHNGTVTPLLALEGRGDGGDGDGLHDIAEVIEAEVDAFHGLSSGNEDGLCRRAFSYVRGVSNTLGLGSAFGFGLGLASLLLGNSSPRAAAAGAFRVYASRCSSWRSWGQATRNCGIHEPYNCSGCGDSSRAGSLQAASGCQATQHRCSPAMIPLPISSSYPCIVMPHPAPAAASAPVAVSDGRGKVCCAAHGATIRCPTEAAAPVAMVTTSGELKRSVSYPLPTLRCPDASVGGTGSNSINAGSGHDRGLTSRGVCSAITAGERQLPLVIPAVVPRVPPLISRRRHELAGMTSLASSYSNLMDRRQPPQLSRARARAPWQLASSPRHQLPSAQTATRSGLSGSGIGGWLGGSNSDEDPLASRVRLGLFVALLPVLLTLWLCMVAWLAAIWIHHYAVLLTVRPDRSWNVRVRTLQDVGSGAEAATAAENASSGGSCGRNDGAGGGAIVAATRPSLTTGNGGGGGLTAVGVAEARHEDAAACCQGAAGTASSRCGGGSYCGEYNDNEVASGCVLRVSLTEAAPPLPPQSQLSQFLQQQQQQQQKQDGLDRGAGGTAVGPNAADPWPSSDLSVHEAPCSLSPSIPSLLATTSLLHQQPNILQPQPWYPASSLSDCRPEPSSGPSPSRGSPSGSPPVVVIPEEQELYPSGGGPHGSVELGELADTGGASLTGQDGSPKVALLPSLLAPPDGQTLGISDRVLPLLECDASGPGAVALEIAVTKPYERETPETSGSLAAGTQAITSKAASEGYVSIEASGTDASMEAVVAVKALVRAVLGSLVRRYDNSIVKSTAPAADVGRTVDTAQEAVGPSALLEEEKDVMVELNTVADWHERLVVCELTRSVFRSLVLREACGGGGGSGEGLGDGVDAHHDSVQKELDRIAYRSKSSDPKEVEDGGSSSGCAARAAVAALTRAATQEESEAAIAGTKHYGMLPLEYGKVQVLQHEQRRPLSPPPPPQHQLLPCRPTHYFTSSDPVEPSASGSEQQGANMRLPAAGAAGAGAGHPMMTASLQPYTLSLVCEAARSPTEIVSVGKSTSDASRVKAMLPTQHLQKCTVEAGPVGATEAGPEAYVEVAKPSWSGAGPRATTDPAVLLVEMIEHLNQLEWQKVDVDTRHYHAHAAIVIRSSRRFRSHMHIIDYAVRQLSL